MGATRVVVERFDVRTADGALLATDVYRLDDTVRRPCLLQRVPYGRTVPTIVNGALDVRRAVDAGFAVVVQDCRGRGGSTGDFVPFDHERDDAVATFDWICEQPWSNGAVGMFGRSYAALNQWLAAESGHPALKAIAPVISGDDPSEWIHPAGVLESGFVLWWSLRYLAPELASRSDDPSSQAALAELVSEPSRLLRIRHVSDLAGVMEHVPFLARWLSEAEPQPRATRREANVPALVIAGWFDIFARSTLDTFKRRSSES
ncbi:MAG TPA: CocE/NonD family hydrolase, partial [Acidimicrobiales bacterium]